MAARPRKAVESLPRRSETRTLNPINLSDLSGYYRLPNALYCSRSGVSGSGPSPPGALTRPPAPGLALLSCHWRHSLLCPPIRLSNDLDRCKPYFDFLTTILLAAFTTALATINSPLTSSEIRGTPPEYHRIRTHASPSLTISLRFRCKSC
jgi:hypothetical protein